jgi:hypothetical protein
MKLLFGVDATEGAFTYAMIIVGAVTVFNLAYPLIGIINNFCTIRRAFLMVFLPGFVFGIVSYTIGGALYGALGMAWANVMAYAGLAVGLALFVSRFRPIAWSWKIVTPEELAMIKNLVSRSGS